MENTFKSSVFGGFNRDDVIRYIEKTSLESKQQIEALEQESDGLCRENAELRDKLAAAERERDKLAESYSTASSAQDALKNGGSNELKSYNRERQGRLRPPAESQRGGCRAAHRRAGSAARRTPFRRRAGAQAPFKRA